MKIIRAWETAKNGIKFVHKNEEGRKVFGEVKFDWFFYVKTEHFKKNSSFFATLETRALVNKYEDDGLYTKVFVDRSHNSEFLDKNNQFVWEFKDFNLNKVLQLISSRDIPHFEADVPPSKRWILSNDIQFEDDLKVLYLDIETDDRTMKGQPIPGEFQILSFSIKDARTQKMLHMKAEGYGDEFEKPLIETLLKYINAYDVIAAFNGCFVAGTKILMADGSEKAIEDVEVGDSVIGYDDKLMKSKITTVKNKFKHNNYKKLYKIKTDYSEVIATEEHPFLVSYNEKFDYVKTPYLRIGDYVTHFRKLDCLSDKKDFDLDDYIFAGMMMTDGHRTKIKTHNKCCFYNTNLKFHKKIRDYLNKHNVSWYEYIQKGKFGKQKDVYRTEFSTTEHLNKIMDFCSIPRGKKTYQHVDLCNVYSQNRTRIKAFLYGLWLGDGFKNTKNIQIANMNADLRYWMIRLLQRLGIYSRQARIYSDGKNAYCGIAELLKSDIPWAFAKKTPLKDGVKRAAMVSDICNNKITCTKEQFKKYFEKCEFPDNLEFEKIVSIEEIDSSEDVYNFETESNNYVANDFIVHNCQFDFPYVKNRAIRYGLQLDWRKILLQDHLEIFKKYGQGLQSYSLDNIGKTIVGRGKVDHGRKIFQLFEDDPVMLREYNNEDVQLMYDIEKKTNYLAVARQINCIGSCPADDRFITRKIDMMVLKQAMEDKHYHFKTKERRVENGDEDEKFTGAYVHEPRLGLYKNVDILDISSLYPNCIKTYNISPDTLVEETDVIPDSEVIKSPSGAKFLRNTVGIFAKVITRMAEQRKHYKKLMETVDPESEEHKTFDRLQYAFKSFGLSFYGAMGEVNTRFYDTRVAEAVTLAGQDYIKSNINFLEKEGYNVYYGDSITKERMTVIRANNMVRLRSFEFLFSLGTKVEYVGEKEISILPRGIEVLSYNFETKQSEFNEIKHVIRHKTNKKVFYYRVRNGTTKVTEDHSLISATGSTFKPSESYSAFCIDVPKTKKLTSGLLDLFSLMKNYKYDRKRGGMVSVVCDDSWIFLDRTGGDRIKFRRHVNLINEEETKSFLFMIAHYICNGASSTPETTTTRFGATYSVENMEYILKFKKCVEYWFSGWNGGILEADGKFRDDLKERNKTWNVTNHNHKVQIMNVIAAIAFKCIAGQKANGKKIPDFVFNLEEKYQRYFLEELINGDGSVVERKRVSNTMSFETSSIELACGVVLIAKNLGIVLSCRENIKDKTFIVISYENENNGKHLSKNSCEQIDYKDYVYDLSVDKVNNFVDAFGNILLHNTDSMFISNDIKYDVNALIEKLNKFCEQLALQRNAIKGTVEFAHDKSFSKWFICAKKRYAGYLTFLDGKYLKEPKLYVAGLEYKRTDVCKYVKKTQEQMIRSILDAKEMTYSEARTFIDQCKQYIIKGDVQLEDIIIGQKLTKSKEDYETETMHLAVVEEMIKDNKEVYVGDKILYYIESIDKEGKGVPRPVYKYKNSFARVYYWNKKIYPALLRILEVVFPKVDWDSYIIGTKGTKKERFFGKTDLWD